MCLCNCWNASGSQEWGAHVLAQLLARSCHGPKIYEVGNQVKRAKGGNSAPGMDFTCSTEWMQVRMATALEALPLQSRGKCTAEFDKLWQAPHVYPRALACPEPQALLLGELVSTGWGEGKLQPQGLVATTAPCLGSQAQVQRWEGLPEGYDQWENRKYYYCIKRQGDSRNGKEAMAMTSGKTGTLPAVCHPVGHGQQSAFPASHPNSGRHPETSVSHAFRGAGVRHLTSSCLGACARARPKSGPGSWPLSFQVWRLAVPGSFRSGFWLALNIIIRIHTGSTLPTAGSRHAAS